MVETWIISHLTFSFFTTEHSTKLCSFRVDARRVFLYILVCSAIFSYGYELHIAFPMSCAIAIFYVFCDMLRKICSIVLNEKTYWTVFASMNLLVIITVLSLYLLLKSYG